MINQTKGFLSVTVFRCGIKLLIIGLFEKTRLNHISLKIFIVNLYRFFGFYFVELKGNQV